MKNGYTEHTVFLLFYSPRLDDSNISAETEVTEFLFQEMMVHTDSENREIYDVYVHTDELEEQKEFGFKKSWISRAKQKNPLFTHLSKEFINEYSDVIREAVSDCLEN